MNKILLLLLIIFLVPYVYSEETYPNLGGVDNDYFSEDSSLFNENLDDSEIADVVPINNGNFIPLVADLNNNGSNQIIIHAGDQIRLYYANQTNTGIELETLRAFDTPNSHTDGKYYSNLLTYDIDSDGMLEVIFFSVEQNHLYILNYNISHFYDTGYNFTLPNNPQWNIGSPDDSSTIMIGCGDSNGCIILFNDRSSYTASGTRYMFARQFNSTSSNNNTQYTISSQFWNPDGPVMCLPKYKNVPYANGKYYATYSNSAGVNGNIYIIRIGLNGSFHFSHNSDLQSGYQLPNTCYGGLTDFTSPHLMNFDIASNELEPGFAYNYDSDEFKLKVLSYDLTSDEDYPSIQKADGILKSNPFTANAFIDSEESSLCVVGYDETQGDYGRLDILCADEQSAFSGITENTQFIHDFTTTPVYNITGLDLYSSMAHSINSKQNDRSEVLTPYGVYELEDKSKAGLLSLCYLNSQCDADRIYNMPVTDELTTISGDFTGVGFEDIITLTTNNLYYIDDGYVNRNAYLGYCTRIRPSPDAIWQLHIEGNTSNQTNEVKVTVKVVDPDSSDNQLRARVLLYADEPNQQDSNWSSDLTNGQQITFSDLYPNETTSGSILRIQVKDNSNYPDTPVNYDYTFIVQTSGDTTTDSDTCVGLTEEEYYSGSSEGGSCQTDSDCQTGLECVNNVCVEDEDIITEQKNDISEVIAPTSLIPESYRSLYGIFIIVIILVMTASFLKSENLVDPKTWFMSMCSVCLFGIIFFTYLGWFPSWFILTIIIIAIAIIGVRITPLYDRFRGY